MSYLLVGDHKALRRRISSFQEEVVWLLTRTILDYSGIFKDLMLADQIPYFVNSRFTLEGIKDTFVT